jgi:hypothetical protein
MKLRTMALLTRIVVVAAVVCAGATASAKTIAGWIQEQSFTEPNGTTFSTCAGSQIWAAAHGYDANGALRCGVRSTVIGAPTLKGECPAAAVTYQISVRSSPATFCSTTKLAWSGPWAACGTPSGFVAVPSSTGTCQRMTIASFGRGY